MSFAAIHSWKHKPLLTILLQQDSGKIPIFRHFFIQKSAYTSPNTIYMKKFFALALFFAIALPAFNQTTKHLPPASGNTYSPEQLRLQWPGKDAVPRAENPFGWLATAHHPLPTLQPVVAGAPTVRITRDNNGMPIFFQGKTAASGSLADTKPLTVRAIEYCASLQMPQIAQASAEFVPGATITDEQGNAHVRLQQVFQGIPVYGGEVIAHTQNGSFALLNGRYYPTPRLASITPTLNANAAIQQVKNLIGPDKIKANWTSAELKLIDGQPFEATLMVYHPKRELTAERLAWVVAAHPNILTRTVYFLDANTGELIHHFDHVCKLDGGHLHHSVKQEHQTASLAETAENAPAATAPWVLNGPVTANGQDLFGINRTFGAYQIGSQFLLQDASKSMFNAAQSNMPNDPVGAIVTLNAKNTSPEVPATFDYDFVTANSTTFNDKNAVSVHWNANVSFDYYKNTFGRNSIDGIGGSILAFYNVVEDGASMENAFWNGVAMWYGNGGTTFKQLARSLDVGGHEMTHGVIEKTANLEYQDESGALNESFADVFGAMIDRDDWLIGEDVMQPGQSPTGALRSLQDPHNGSTSNDNFWQPRVVSEQYNGSENNGGVHINSGIPNWAFYKFASNAAVGKDKAEKVYYKALNEYLVKSSQFVDARIAIIQAATDLYGNAVATVAADAFTAVGILGSQPGGNYLGQLQVNAGDDLIVCADNSLTNLDLALGNGTVLGTFYNEGVSSRPSVTDDGTNMVFVNDNQQIIGVTFDYSVDPIQFTTTVLSTDAVWRGTAISKDGRYVAGLTTLSTTQPNNDVYIFDLSNGASKQFFLSNPTYSEGQSTGDVQNADVLEFDYSGDFLMYDAFNKLEDQGGQSIEYWDIGFLQFRENGQFADGQNPFISKLFSGLPENTSIGNPAFAKNSPYIIAFDYIDEYNEQNDIYGANVETGDYNILVSNNGTLGWPNYNRLDNAVIYQGNSSTSTNIYTRGVKTNKIESQGAETELIDSHEWGVWYATGNRSLLVNTNEQAAAALQLQINPNPATDGVRVMFTIAAAAPVQLSLVNLLGQTLQNRTVEAAMGQNSFDLNLQGLPTGTYLVRIQTGTTGALVKVVKQ